MKLTAQQEKFAQLLAAGNLSDTDCYIEAYPAAKKWNRASASRQAHTLKNNPKIIARVKELKKALEKRELWTREKSVQALIQAFKVARSQSNASGMTGAIREINLMHGFNEPERVEVTHTRPVKIIVEGYDPDEE